MWKKQVQFIKNNYRKIWSREYRTGKTAKTENSKQIFPEKELRGLSPHFNVHVSVSNLYIPTISVCLFCRRKICGPIPGKYKSLTDTRMWKLGWKPHNSLSGIHKWDFRCSAHTFEKNMWLDIGKLFNKWRERNIISGVENKIEIESRATASFNNNKAKKYKCAFAHILSVGHYRYPLTRFTVKKTRQMIGWKLRTIGGALESVDISVFSSIFRDKWTKPVQNPSNFCQATRMFQLFQPVKNVERQWTKLKLPT